MVAQHTHKVNVIIMANINFNYNVRFVLAPFCLSERVTLLHSQKVFYLFLCSGKLNATVSEIFPDEWEQGARAE